MKRLPFFLLFVALFSLVAFSSCEDDSGSNGPDITTNPPKSKRVSFANAAPAAGLPIGDSLAVNLSFSGAEAQSVDFFLNGVAVEGAVGSGTSFEVSTALGKIGMNALTAECLFPDQTKESITMNFRLVSDVVPEKLEYQLVSRHDHSIKYYTQGLMLEGNRLYEGTGLKGESRLVVYDRNTFKQLQDQSLGIEFFGEGITLFQDKLYQLTYQSNKVFVYDKMTLEKVQEFYWYSEGWGLTTIGDELLLSDGSANLYYIDPNAFTEIRKIEVADHRAPVLKLNELEYVDGLVWANIWQSDRIVAIDPETGKVMKEVDLGGIMPGFESEVEQDYVLNGIAWDAARGVFIISGKKWPSMFEVRFVGVG